MQTQNKILSEALTDAKREIEVTKITLLADCRREKESADKNLNKQVTLREEKINELKVMHDAQMVETKDKLTRQIVELERKLESLQ